MRQPSAAASEPSRLFLQEKSMPKNFITKMFGSAGSPKAAKAASRKEKTLATVNESDTTVTKPRTRRTVGLTEQRLRARNKESWMTSTKGWSNLFGRFTASAKR